MKGVSLIETLIVIALIVTLSFIGTNSYINFKNDAGIDNAVNELISDIKLARNKSMNGELLDGEKPEDFSELPEYGINVFDNGYKIIRKYSILNESAEMIGVKEEIQITILNPQYTLSPSGEEFYFERISGKTPNITLNLSDNHGNSREISINEDFLITLKEN